MKIVDVAPREWDIKIGISMKEAFMMLEWLSSAESKMQGSNIKEANQVVQNFFRLLEQIKKDLPDGQDSI